MTSDVTDTSFAVSWTAAPGNVRQYRVMYKSLFTTESGEAVIPGSSTTTVLKGLTPETRYEVSVFAVYGHGRGQPLVGEETTDGKLLFFFLDTFLVCLLSLSTLHTLFVGSLKASSRSCLESVKLSMCDVTVQP